MGVNICMIMPFEPVTKLRPRVIKRRGMAHTYTPYKTRAFENRVLDYYMEHSKGYKFEQGVPIRVSINFGMPVPKSFTKKKRAQIAEGELWHTVKPDCDNLAKAILDALNEVAWHDDAQIAELCIQKGYCLAGPYIELRISALEGGITNG